MLLVFDVGNTNIVMGVYQEERLVHSWRMTTDRGKTADEYEDVYKRQGPYRPHP